MRNFTDRHDYSWDLDDLKTYERYPQDKWEVLEKLYGLIGYSKLYLAEKVDYKSDSRDKQIERISRFVKEIGTNFSHNIHNQSLQWWQEQLFMFENETENLC